MVRRPPLTVLYKILLILDLSSTCGLKCFMLDEDVVPKPIKTAEALPQKLPQVKVGNDCVEPAREGSGLLSAQYSDAAILQDSESSEILQFRRVHIKSAVLAHGAFITSPKSYGFLRHEEYNPDLEHHRGANPVIDRVDGKLYLRTIHWVIRKVRFTNLSALPRALRPILKFSARSELICCIFQGEELPANFEKHIDSEDSFAMMKKKWLCEDTLFVSDTWQESHYHIKHPLNCRQSLLSHIRSTLIRINASVFRCQKSRLDQVRFNKLQGPKTVQSATRRQAKSIILQNSLHARIDCQRWQLKCGSPNSATVWW